MMKLRPASWSVSSGILPKPNTLLRSPAASFGRVILHIAFIPAASSRGIRRRRIKEELPWHIVEKAMKIYCTDRPKTPFFEIFGQNFGLFGSAKSPKFEFSDNLGILADKQ